MPAEGAQGDEEDDDEPVGADLIKEDADGRAEEGRGQKDEGRVVPAIQGKRVTCQHGVVGREVAGRRTRVASYAMTGRWATCGCFCHT